MVHKTNKGPFCRDCGTALLRHHQNSTLFQGWFGIFSFFITPITLLLNLGAWRKVKALGPPQRDPSVESKIPAPLNPGNPPLRRPAPLARPGWVADVLVFLRAAPQATAGFPYTHATPRQPAMRLSSRRMSVAAASRNASLTERISSESLQRPGITLLAASGMSAAYVPCNATVVRWFTLKRGLALSITSSGASFGMFIFPPLTTALITMYGWRGAYLILGSLAACAIIGCASFIVRDPERMGLHPDGQLRELLVPERAAMDIAESASFTLAEARHTGAF